MSGLLLGMVLSVFICLFHNMVILLLLLLLIIIILLLLLVGKPEGKRPLGRSRLR